MVSWSDRYSLIPYVDGGRTMQGADCWGLVRLIYARELKIQLPSYGEISAEDLIKVAENVNAGKDGEEWADIAPDDVKPFDVCVMKFGGTRRIGHVGVVVRPGNILHVEKGIDAVIVPTSHFTIRERIACYRRHRLTGV